MMIKTLDNVYINMEDFSGFTIGYPNDSDFTVMAMKELVDNQTATIELGRYPSEKEAKDALKKMIEHQDDIKKAEFFGREEGFYYISNIFTMPKPSKNGKADVKRFMIEGREYTVPLKVINEIHRQDMIDYGENIAENRELSWKMAKSLMYMKMRLIRITKGITLNNIKPKKGKFYEIIIRKRKKRTCS